MTGGNYPRLPCLDIMSRYLVCVSNVSASLNWKRLKEDIRVAVHSRVRFVETFEAWLGHKCPHVVIEFDNDRGFENFIRLQQWWLNEHFKSNRVMVNAMLKGVSRDEFFAQIRRLTGVDLFRDRGRPPRRWVDELIHRKDHHGTPGMKRGRAGMPANQGSGASERSRDHGGDGVGHKRSRHSPSLSDKSQKEKETPHFTAMRTVGGERSVPELEYDSASDGNSTSAASSTRSGKPTPRSTFFAPAHAAEKAATGEDDVNMEDVQLIDVDEKDSSATGGDVVMENDDVPIDHQSVQSETTATPETTTETEMESKSDSPHVGQPQTSVETHLSNESSSSTQMAHPTDGAPQPVTRRIGSLAKLIASRRASVTVDSGTGGGISAEENDASNNSRPASRRTSDPIPIQTLVSRSASATAGSEEGEVVSPTPSTTPKPTPSDGDAGLGVADQGGVVSKGSAEPSAPPSAPSRRSQNLLKLVAAAKKSATAGEQQNNFLSVKPDSVESRPSAPDEMDKANSGDAGDALPHLAEHESTENCGDEREKSASTNGDGEKMTDAEWVDSLFKL